MPARRSTGNRSGDGSSSGATSPSSPDNDDAYKLKRQRNNVAVKKTREKSKETAKERRKHVEILQKENLVLETQIDAKKRNIETLKDLLLQGVKTEDHAQTIRKILEAPTDDEDD